MQDIPSATEAAHDRAMMARCIALAREAGERGEYPYGAVICRGETVIAEGASRVRHDGDVTHHAEMVVISKAQTTLQTTSLDDCTIYTSAEPCVQCAYAIRESRIGRVVFGMRSPFIGGMSRWNVLGDGDISRTMSEVFAPPPVIVAGFMAEEVEAALIASDPLVWGIVKTRGLFGERKPQEVAVQGRPPGWPERLKDHIMAFLRRNFFDYFGRR
ncbi:MAG: nucleoside deaminase [Variibacter sp.]